MIISVPHDWVPVPIEVFEQHLETCDDYTRTGYVGTVAYEYRHNGKRFAIVVERDGTLFFCIALAALMLIWMLW